MPLNLELPYPPSANHYWRMWRGRIVISEPGRAYRRTVVNLLRAAQVQPMAGHLAVHVQAFPPDNRRRDLDNLHKCLNDSLQHGGAFHDDAQIVWLLIEKAQTLRPAGKVQVHIQERP